MDQNKDKSVTIQDIAKKLNIATSTVSRALKDHPRISEETKKKVWFAAKKLGYRSHLKEAHFYSEKTNNIAVILPHLDSWLYKGFLKGFQKVTSHNKYNLLIFLSENSEERESELFDLISDLRVDGVAFSLSPYYNKTENLQKLSDQKIPLLCYNSLNFNLDIPKLVLDHYQSGFKAVNHFISVGCSRIAQLLGNKKNQIYTEIVNGHKAALQKKGMQFNESYIIHSDLGDEDIESALKMLMNLDEPPTGIAVKNNLVAIQVLRILEKNSIKVPDEVAVLSYESDEFNKYLNPSVSTITFSAQKLGKKAAGIIFEQIENKKTGEITLESTIIEPNKLVIRSSSMRE